MALTDSLKILLIDTAKSLQGSARRLFMARTVTALGPGGPQRAARELRWGRMTRRKGRRARTRGVHCLDACSLRGRKRAAEPLPHRLSDRRAIVDSHSQAAPQFPLPAPLDPPDSGRGAAPVAGSERLRGGDPPDRGNPRHHVACTGRLPAERREESAAKKRPATDAICAQGAGVNRAADAADTV
jgi:hypothetical protein